METPAQAPLSAFRYGEIQEAARHRDIADMVDMEVATAVIAVEVATVVAATAAEAVEVIEESMPPLFS